MIVFLAKNILYACISKRNEVFYFFDEDLRSKPKCLICFGENIRPIAFGQDGVSEFKHKCGGKLHISSKKTEVRFNFSTQTIILDEFGRPFQQ